MGAVQDLIVRYVTPPVEGNFPPKPEDALSVFKALDNGLMPKDEAYIKQYALEKDPSKGYFYVSKYDCRNMNLEELTEMKVIREKRAAALATKRAERQAAKTAPPEPFTCCFTGRRPKDLCGYNHDGYKPFMNYLVQYLGDLYDQGARKFISGGAQGFDQLAFWAVERLKTFYPEIQNVVYIPFDGQSRIWAETGAFSQAEYKNMLKKADDVVCLVSDVDQMKIPQYLKDRNIAMVDAADVVVAMYPDDSWKTNAGGTSHCMRYAAKEGKQIHQLRYEINNAKVHPTDALIIGERKPKEKSEDPEQENNIIPFKAAKAEKKTGFESLAGKNIICFDTETTGFGSYDEIIQLTITGICYGNAEVLYSNYFKPEHTTSWPNAEKVNHISPEMVANRPLIKDRIGDLRKFFDEADVICGYNVEYDTRMLRQSTNGAIDIPKNKTWDVVKYFKENEPGPHKLADAVKFYCPDRLDWFTRNAHDASADALMTLEVLIAQAAKNGVDLTEDERSRE